MELNVNSPAYFKDYYGIDDEVYNFFQNAYLFFLDKKYSDILQIVGIIPIVAPQELYDSGEWEESIQLVANKSCAIVSLRIDFEEYYNADSENKISLTKELVLKAVKKLNSKVSFNYEMFQRDLEQLRID